MTAKNTKTLVIIFSSLVLAQTLLTVLFYYQARLHVREDAEREIKEILLTHRSIHSYVEEIQKPEVYRLKEEGKLYQEYFSPKLLSFTYTARGITKYLNEERSRKGLAPVYFKLASTNPRNLVNTADTKEARLLEKMDQDLIDEYSEYISVNGEPFLHYAIPIAPNKKSCMRCHSTPSLAPRELIAQYGDKRGFNEKVGDVRALISIRLPLADWTAKHYGTANSLTLTAFLSFCAIFLTILYFIRQIDRQEVDLQTARDIAERSGKKKSMLLRNIVNSMPSILIGMDKHGKVNLWNRQAELSSGISHEVAIGNDVWKHCLALTGVEDRIRTAIEERGELHLEKLPRQRDGEIDYLDIMVYPLGENDDEGAVIRVDDVSERARMEDTMVQTEKMMSVGGLAAGMAHEINNPLGGILQGAQNLQRRLSLEIPANIQAAHDSGTSLEAIHDYMERRGLLKFIDGIKDSGLRASKIVENMLSFSRKTDSTMKPCSLNEIIDQTIELAWNDYDLKKKFDFRHIEIIKEYSSTIPHVPCVGTEIEQVVLNLLKNASQAIAEVHEDGYKAQIILRTIQRGNKAVIQVEDNGPGIDESTCKRIFEPFFTTKEVGVGTGLGLSVSYFIITENHNGSMTVSSTLGKGTIFAVELPINRESKL